MNYINTTTAQYPVSEAAIRAAYPDTSFPAAFSPPPGYAPVFPAPASAFDANTHAAREIAPELTALGKYEQRWEIYPLEAEQIEAIRKSKVPSAVTMRQARLALLGAGLLDDVDAAIALIPDATTRKAAQIEWEFSNEVQRFNSFTSMLGGGLGLTAEQVDQLFVQAATL